MMKFALFRRQKDCRSAQPIWPLRGALGLGNWRPIRTGICCHDPASQIEEYSLQLLASTDTWCAPNTVQVELGFVG